MKREYIRDLNYIQSLLNELAVAGFGSGMCTASSIIDELDRSKSSLLRQFYLAAMGMGAFRFRRPTIVDMRGPGHAITERYEQTPWYSQLKPARPCSEFSPKFNLRRMCLYLPVRPKEKCISFITLLGRIRRARRSDGTVWHAHWLFHHQECIPASWQKILRNGGKIVFAGVILLRECEGRPAEESVEYYPYLYGSKGKMSFSFAVETADDLKFTAGRDYFAHIPVK